jgi:hypothetical protein
MSFGVNKTLRDVLLNHRVPVTYYFFFPKDSVYHGLLLSSIKLKVVADDRIGFRNNNGLLMKQASTQLISWDRTAHE